MINGTTIAPAYMASKCCSERNVVLAEKTSLTFIFFKLATRYANFSSSSSTKVTLLPANEAIRQTE